MWSLQLFAPDLTTATRLSWTLTYLNKTSSNNSELSCQCSHQHSQTPHKLTVQIPSLAWSPWWYPLQNSMSYLQCPPTYQPNSPAIHSPTAQNSFFIMPMSISASAYLNFSTRSLIYAAPTIWKWTPEKISALSEKHFRHLRKTFPSSQKNI